MTQLRVRLEDPHINPSLPFGAMGKFRWLSDAAGRPPERRWSREEPIIVGAEGYSSIDLPGGGRFSIEVVPPRGAVISKEVLVEDGAIREEQIALGAETDENLSWQQFAGIVTGRSDLKGRRPGRFPPWNSWVDGPARRLAGFESPRNTDLAALLNDWDKELADARLRLVDYDEEDTSPPGEEYETFGTAINVAKLAKAAYEPDTKRANGSSIAFIAEFKGKRILLTGDTYSEVIEAELAPLAKAEGGRYRLDLLKLSHHGSRNNTSPDLLRLIDCTRFAISTDGSRKHKHPHAETIARLLAADPDRTKTLYFNYIQPQTTCWDRKLLGKRWNYTCVFPTLRKDARGNGTLVISI
jgi:hypothetical protein